jgi:hypothetical protein
MAALQPCPAGLALAGVPCGCAGRNPSHRAAAEQSRRNTAVLDQAFRAFAFTYGGTSRSDYAEPEDLAAFDAMIAVGRVLGKVGC